MTLYVSKTKKVLRVHHKTIVRWSYVWW